MDKQEMIEGLLNSGSITTEDAMRLAEDNELDVAREYDHHMQKAPAPDDQIERLVTMELKGIIDGHYDNICEAIPFHYESCMLKLDGEGLLILTEGGTYLSVTVKEIWL